MDFFQAVILGIVQGLTEFLPVSSSGHLVLFQKFLGIEEHSLIFDVAVHLGTLASVITVYFRFIRNTTVSGVKSISSGTMSPELKLILFVVAATIPTAVIGLSFKSTFESLFSNIMAVGICLTLTGFLLLLTRGRGEERQQDGKAFLSFSIEDLTTLSWQKALLIGLAQAGAIAPGISRSGTTIAVAILLGLPRNLAALFSFMLAIPAILGAGILQLKGITHLGPQDIMGLGVGFAVAYVSGLAGLLGVLHFVKKGRLEVFTVYLWILGGACVFWSLKGG